MIDPSLVRASMRREAAGSVAMSTERLPSLVDACTAQGSPSRGTRTTTSPSLLTACTSVGAAAKSSRTGPSDVFASTLEERTPVAVTEPSLLRSRMPPVASVTSMSPSDDSMSTSAAM